jgi:hypothetical protein
MSAARRFWILAVTSCALAFANGFMLAIAAVIFFRPFCAAARFCGPFEFLVFSLNAMMMGLNIGIVWRWMKWRRAMREAEQFSGGEE